MGEVIVEFKRVGNIIKVIAFDAETMTEVSMMAPVGTSEQILHANIMQKLRYVLEKKKS